MNTLNRTVTTTIAVILSGPAQAALFDRGGGLIYDDVLNVTWLQDANYAKTSGYDVDGDMTWHAAQEWVAALSYYDTVRGVTYSDWRLPATGPVNGTTYNYKWALNGSSDYGYNISEEGSVYAGSTASEMAHLFYNSLNNKGLCDPLTSTAVTCSGPQPGWGMANRSPFINFQSDLPADYYWSSTDFAPGIFDGYAFDFSFYHGGQGGLLKAGTNTAAVYALAVRDGDVASVPEPAGALLTLTALSALALSRRRVS